MPPFARTFAHLRTHTRLENACLRKRKSKSGGSGAGSRGLFTAGLFLPSETGRIPALLPSPH